MRKLIFSMNTSLDGYIEGPNRELDWTIADAELHDFFTDLLLTGDVMLWGRVTYELMLNYWPNASSDPQVTESELRFANAVNPMKKIVYSKTLNEVRWNTELRHTLSLDEIREMKAQSGGNILLGGGATLALPFIQNGLVDEYQLVIHPAAIMNGKALFGGLNKMMKLDLQWNRRFSSGAVVLCYHEDKKT
ncbi:MAG TPA: dihydrofolate reductase family protein [Anaerolineales bacterium]|nr:dihydrofolate reductase family protein [Anaerolineales bacterium]